MGFFGKINNIWYVDIFKQVFKHDKDPRNGLTCVSQWVGMDSMYTRVVHYQTGDKSRSVLLLNLYGLHGIAAFLPHCLANLRCSGTRKAALHSIWNHTIKLSASKNFIFITHEGNYQLSKIASVVIMVNMIKIPWYRRPNNNNNKVKV